MTNRQALQIVWELANENRIHDHESEPDLVAIREEQDQAFALIEELMPELEAFCGPF